MSYEVQTYEMWCTPFQIPTNWLTLCSRHSVWPKAIPSRSLNQAANVMYCVYWAKKERLGQNISIVFLGGISPICCRCLWMFFFIFSSPICLPHAHLFVDLKLNLDSYSIGRSQCLREGLSISACGSSLLIICHSMHVAVYMLYLRSCHH